MPPQEYRQRLTDSMVKWYKGLMAKHLVKATHSGNQIRVSLPVPLLVEMRWKEISYFVLERIDPHTVSIQQALTKEEMD